jgi:hypothetical protein
MLKTIRQQTVGNGSFVGTAPLAAPTTPAPGVIDYVQAAIPAAWQAAHVYVVGDRVINGGNAYVCITGGTSAGAGGPTTTAADITDNTVHWSYQSAAGDAGGLFDPGYSIPLWLERFEFFASVNAAWALYKVSNDGTTTWTMKVYSGAADQVFISQRKDRIMLLPGEKLKLVAAALGGTDKMMASVSFQDREIE